jgi:hypothetical protein
LVFVNNRVGAGNGVAGPVFVFGQVGAGGSSCGGNGIAGSVFIVVAIIAAVTVSVAAAAAATVAVFVLVVVFLLSSSLVLLVLLSSPVLLLLPLLLLPSLSSLLSLICWDLRSKRWEQVAVSWMGKCEMPAERWRTGGTTPTPLASSTRSALKSVSWQLGIIG